MNNVPPAINEITLPIDTDFDMSQLLFTRERTKNVVPVSPDPSTAAPPVVHSQDEIL